MDLIAELEWRELFYDASEGLRDALAAGPITGYIGFDPTAASLHVGSLLTVMGLARLQRAGHSPIAIVGGGTGLIGDPSGKTQERTLLTMEQVQANVGGIRAQLARFLDFDRPGNPARIVNNADWLVPMDLMSFLRDVGKHFTVNYMMAKDSVKRRLESDEGISFTEFSYLLMQAYVFVMLYDRYGCTLQMGGSDQWGNITAGIDLMRKLRGVRAHGLVFPLMTTSAGIKFGKTEAGSVWLDPNLTSPYRFYQYWINIDDSDVVKYLKFFTMLDQQAIAELEHSVAVSPEKREAQKRLAAGVTRTVHGESNLRKAIHASRVLFGGVIEDLSASDVLDIFAEVPSSEMPGDIFSGDGVSLVDLVITCGFATSKGAARRLIEDGGIYVNNRRVSDVQATIDLSALIEGQYVVLRKGARNYHLVRVV